jgi:hypothetical protein
VREPRLTDEARRIPGVEQAVDRALGIVVLEIARIREIGRLSLSHI